MSEPLTGAALVEAVARSIAPSASRNGLPIPGSVGDARAALRAALRVALRAALRAAAAAAGVDAEGLQNAAYRCVSPNAGASDIHVARLLRALAEVVRDE